MRTMLEGQTCSMVWGDDFEAFPVPPLTVRLCDGMSITAAQQIAYEAYLRINKIIRAAAGELGEAYAGVHFEILAAEK